MTKSKAKYEDLEKKIRELEEEVKKGRIARKSSKKLEKRFAELLDERDKMGRLISAIRATVDMPELYLDQNWNIVGYSGNFPSLTRKVVELTEKRKNIREFLKEGDFEQIEQYLLRVKALETFPYDEGKKWRLRYKGPNATDKIGESWILYKSCEEIRWQIKEKDGKLKIIHRAHIQDDVDCYLMSAEEFGGPDEDIKIIYKVKTCKKEENICDLSLVLSGSSGREETVPDLVGYTACSGSNHNSEARLQRQTANINSVPESLIPDTEYQITVERTGGRIRRLLKNLRTQKEASPLEMIDANAIYDRQNHIGFTTFSGVAEIYDIEIYTRKSIFFIDQFKIPFNFEVGIRDKDLEGRVFKLRAGRDESIGKSFNTLMFEDITDRARLQYSLQQHISELSLINELSGVLLSTTELSEVLGVILIGVTASQGLGFNRAFLLLVDTQEKALVGRMAIGPSNEEEAGIIWHELNHRGLRLCDILASYKSSVSEKDIHVNEIVRRIRIPLSEVENPLVRCVRYRQSFNIRNGVAECRLPGWLAELLGTDTLAIVPMVCNDRCIGLLLADNLINRKPIAEHSLHLLRVFASIASQAIERSELYLSLEEKISDLDRAYRQLEESKDKLIHAERLSAVGEVTATVAHEIRNPLVSIGGFARSLEKELSEDDPKREKLRIIIDEVKRLERYLKDTLTFIRYKVPVFFPTDPNILVQETIQMMHSEIESINIEIELEMMENPPLIEIDPDQIRQVLLNILRNSLEAMPIGGRLTVSSGIENEMFTIRVADTGEGIEKKHLEKIFTPFYSTKNTGTGLGLTISRQIIKKHGGVMGISSEREVGTVFQISLPVEQPGIGR